MTEPLDRPESAHDARILAWRLSKRASDLTERRRRSEVRWLRRNAVASMRRAAQAPLAGRQSREDLALMLENLALTFVEQLPGRSLDGPLGEPDLLEEALSASREMVELQVGIVVDCWTSGDSAQRDVQRSIERLATLSATRRTVVVNTRLELGSSAPRLEPGVSAAQAPPDDASVADHVAAAWDLNQRVIPGNPLDTWRTRVANANAAVLHLRQAEALTAAESQIQQDLVYLLSGLARTLLDVTDEDPGNISAALAASSEAVLRQAAIVAEVRGASYSERGKTDALETLVTVYADFIAAHEAAGLRHDGG